VGEFVLSAPRPGGRGAWIGNAFEALLVLLGIAAAILSALVQ
jgi:hypothetical protein